MALLSSRPPKVEKLRRKGDVDALLRALTYTDQATDRQGNVVDLGVSIRASAAEALAESDAPAAKAGLLSALNDSAEGVRLAVVGGLKKRSDAATTNALLDGVIDWVEPEHSGSRREALDALCALSESTLPERAAAALLRRDSDLTADDEEVLRRLIGADGSGNASTRVIDVLVGALGNEDEATTRDRATAMLLWLAPESVDALISALEHGSPDRQRRVALALGRTHDARCVLPLERVLESEHEHVRGAVATALGDVHDPSAVEALLRASADPSYAVRLAATAGLDRLGGVAVVLGVTAFIRPLLLNESSPWDPAEVESAFGRALQAQPSLSESPEPPGEIAPQVRPLPAAVASGPKASDSSAGFLHRLRSRYR